MCAKLKVKMVVQTSKDVIAIIFHDVVEIITSQHLNGNF